MYSSVLPVVGSTNEEVGIVEVVFVVEGESSAMTEEDDESKRDEDCIGRPISLAELVRLAFEVCVDRLNICGIRGREREEVLVPSGG